MTAATTRVLRDGSVQTLPTTEVVPGDMLIIEEGDTIAADARVLLREADLQHHLSVEEDKSAAQQPATPAKPTDKIIAGPASTR